MSKVRKLLGMVAAWAPTNALRVFLYRSLFGYRFGRRMTIGIGTLILVESFDSGDDVFVGRGTSFVGPMRIKLAHKSWIGRFNKFVCGEATIDERHRNMNYAREFVMGLDSMVLEDHLFDVYGRIEIGAGSWVAGYGSQFLTHGASAMDRDIAIGSGCYLGSAVRFTPGSGIGNNVILGMGSVVTKRVPGDDIVVAGMPAKEVRRRGDDDKYVFSKSAW